MGSLGLEAPDYDFLGCPPPAPAPGNPLLTEAETSDIQHSMDHMTSVAPAYGNQNYGEGFNTQEFDLPTFLGVASSFGVPMQQNMSTHSVHGSYSGAARGMDFSSFSSMPASSMSMPPSSMSMSVPQTAPGLVTSGPQDFTIAMPVTTDFFVPSAALVSTAPLMNPTTPTYAPPNGMVHDPRPSPTMLQHSPDVLEAATALQSGSHHRSHSIHNIPQHRPSNQGMGPPVGHLRHQDMNDFHQERRRMSESIEVSHEDIFKKWAFEGNTFPNTPRQPRASAPVNLQYGSDMRFNGNQPFLPQSEKESFEGMSQQQDLYMRAVKLADSADSTRVPSPELDPVGGLSLRTMGRQHSLSIDTNVNGRAKRVSLDIDRSAGRKRKPINRDSTDSPGADGIDGKKKRRKSAGGVKKENLTEKQKRENHIKSERKRRGVIDVGFKNLNKMVPSLAGQNPSKAATLTSAHEFFVEMTVGNAELRNMLGQVQ